MPLPLMSPRAKRLPRYAATDDYRQLRHARQIIFFS